MTVDERLKKLREQNSQAASSNDPTQNRLDALRRQTNPQQMLGMAVNLYRSQDPTSTLGKYGAQSPYNALPLETQPKAPEGNTRTKTMNGVKTTVSARNRNGGDLPVYYGKGNIDLNHRPIYRNDDGTISTVESKSFGIDGKEVLLPTIGTNASGDAIRWTDEQALQHYYDTGENLGIFNTPDEATAYAKVLHDYQERLYSTFPAASGFGGKGIGRKDIDEYHAWKTEGLDTLDQLRKDYIKYANATPEERAAAGVDLPTLQKRISNVESELQSRGIDTRTFGGKLNDWMLKGVVAGTATHYAGEDLTALGSIGAAERESGWAQNELKQAQNSAARYKAEMDATDDSDPAWWAAKTQYDAAMERVRVLTEQVHGYGRADAALAKGAELQQKGLEMQEFGKESAPVQMQIGNTDVDALLFDALSMGVERGLDVVTNAVLPGSMGGFFARAYGGAYQKARSEGASAQQAAIYGASVGAIEVATEKISSLTLGQRAAYGKGWGDALADDVVNGMTEWFRTKAGQNAAYYLGRLTAAGFGEFVEELIGNIAEAPLEMIYNGKEANLKTVLGAMTSEETINQALQEGLTAALSAIFGGAITPSNYNYSGSNEQIMRIVETTMEKYGVTGEAVNAALQQAGDTILRMGNDAALAYAQEGTEIAQSAGERAISDRLLRSGKPTAQELGMQLVLNEQNAGNTEYFEALQEANAQRAETLQARYDLISSKEFQQKVLKEDGKQALDEVRREANELEQALKRMSEIKARSDAQAAEQQAEARARQTENRSRGAFPFRAPQNRAQESAQDRALETAQETARDVTQETAPTGDEELLARLSDRKYQIGLLRRGGIHALMQNRQMIQTLRNRIAQQSGVEYTGTKYNEEVMPNGGEAVAGSGDARPGAGSVRREPLGPGQRAGVVDEAAEGTRGVNDEGRVAEAGGREDQRETFRPRKGKDAGAAGLQYGREVSAVDFRIKGGNKQQTVRIVESGTTKDINTAKTVAGDSEVILYGGGYLSAGGNNTIEAWSQPNLNRMGLATDDPNFWTSQLAGHERCEILLGRGKIDAEDIAALAEGRLPDGAIDDVLDDYEDLYPGVSRDDLLKEMVCDAAGLMNRYEAYLRGTSMYNGDVSDAFDTVLHAIHEVLNEETDGAFEAVPDRMGNNATAEKEAEVPSARNDTNAEPHVQSVSGVKYDATAEPAYDGSDTAVIDADDGTRFSIKSTRSDFFGFNWDTFRQGKMYKDMRSIDLSEEDIRALFDGIRDLVEYMMPNRAILDMNEETEKGDRKYKPYKPNSDPLYKVSLDFSTLCRKRLMTQFIIEQLQLRENRSLSAEEQLTVRNMLIDYRAQDKALQVACAMCYVESARLKSPKFINAYLENPEPVIIDYLAKKSKSFSATIRNRQADFKEERGYSRNAAKKDMSAADVKELNRLTPQWRREYTPSAEERAIIDYAKTLPNSTYLTAENLAKLASGTPADQTIYAAYTNYIREMTHSKGLETGVAYYYGDSKAVSAGRLAGFNAENGLRFDSWSDFQFEHLLDMMTAVIDLSTRKAGNVRGAKMHGYTKFTEMVRIFGKTGMMFNLSGVSEGDGFNKDGSLRFSKSESVDYDEAVKVRDQFPETAGLQCIGINDKHILALLASDMIDYIIPYHRSGMNATLRRMAGIDGWTDYEGTQEASIDQSVRFDPEKHDAKTWHKEPVFSEFFVGYGTGMSGLEAMRASAENYKRMCAERGMKPKFEKFSGNENYWKLLIDRKMINQKTGALIEQRPVRPVFDFNAIKKEIDKYVENYDPELQNRALDYITKHWQAQPVEQASILGNEMLASQQSVDSSKSDTKFSSAPADLQSKINQSMTMERARQMIQRAFVLGGIKEWFDGKYQNGDEWARGEGASDVAMIVDNEYTLQAAYLDKIKGVIDGDFYAEDIINAYLKGTLTGKQEKPQAKADLSNSTAVNDHRFYAPKQIADAKAALATASQRMTKANEKEVVAARAKVLMFAHKRGAAAALGITDAELNKKLRAWSNYSAQARRSSQNINAGVQESNRWTGIENSAYIMRATVTQDDVAKMVGNIEGDSDGYQNKYIARTMLALDTHIDWSWLNFKFDTHSGVNADKPSGKCNGYYLSSSRLIHVVRNAPNTVAHEMGHALDDMWGREVGVGGFLTESSRNSHNISAEVRPWFDRFHAFCDTLVDSSDISSAYSGNIKETFARFVDRFVGWTEQLATGHASQDRSYYRDHFTAQQFIDFARLLQEKAALDANSLTKNEVPNTQFSSAPADLTESQASMITPQQDADYLAAVERGDMETAQRMVDEAAKAAGYTIKAYHGTTEDFTKFSRGKQGQNHDDYLEFGAGFYFTPSENEARKWVSRGRGGRSGKAEPKIMTVYLAPDSIIHADDPIPRGAESLQRMGLSKAEANFVAGRTYRFINYLIEDKGFSNTEAQEELKAIGYSAIDATYRNGTTGQYVVFDPEQIKSADPVTYDDNGNVIPLSERFNPKKPDIRYSSAPDIVRLEQENRLLRERLEDARAQAKATKGFKARPEDVTRVAKSVIASVDSTIPQSFVEKSIRNIVELAAKGDVSNSEIEAAAETLAANIVNQSAPLKASKDSDGYAAAKKYLKGIRILVPDTLRAEFRDFAAFAAASPDLKMRKEGVDVHVAYEALQEQLGTEFFPKGLGTEKEMLEQMSEVLESLKPVMESQYDFGIALVTQDVRNTILDSILDIRQAKPTAVDVERGKAQEAKAEARETTKKLKVAESYIQQIQKTATRRAQQMKALKEDYAETKKRQSERREESILRQRLLKHYRRLNNAKLPALTKAEIARIGGDLDTIAVSITERKIVEVKGLYDFLRDKTEKGRNPDLYDPDFVVDRRTLETAERWEKTQISQLTITDVRERLQALLNIEARLAAEKKLVKSSMDMMFAHAAQRVMNDLAVTRPGHVGSLLRPTTAALRITYNERSPLTIAMREMVKGEERADLFKREATKPFLPFMSNKEFWEQSFGKKAKTVKIQGVDAQTGEKVTVEITPMMRIGLYLHSLNNDNYRHIYKGGIVIPDMELYRKGKTKDAYNAGKTIKLSRTQLQRIAEQMTQMERDFAKKIQWYFDEYAPPIMNQTSSALDGYEKFTTEDYYPITVDRDFLHADFEGLVAQGDASLARPGFGEERIKSVKPIVLYDANSLLFDMINRNAAYAYQAIPLYNMNRLLNMEFDKEGKSVKKSLNQAFTDGSAMDYLNYFMSDYGGHKRAKKSALDKYGGTVDKIRNNYAGGVLTLAASTAFVQFASYPTAVCTLSHSALLKAMAPTKIDLSYIDRQTAVFTKRTEGFISQEMGDLKEHGKHIPKTLNWIQGVDVFTTSLLKRAAYFYTREQNPNLATDSDEFRKKVVENYVRTVEQTQPNYSVALRPEIQRNPDPLTRSLIMFVTQPLQQYNLTYEAAIKLDMAQRADRAESTPQTQAALKDAKKNMAKTAVVMIESSFLFAALKVAANAIMGKFDKRYGPQDDDDDPIWAFIRRFGGDMRSAITGMIPMLNSVITLIEAGVDTAMKKAGHKPIFYTKWYGLEVSAISAISDAAEDSMKALATLATARDRESVAKAAKATITAAEDIALLFGIPAQKAHEDLAAIAGWFGLKEDDLWDALEG